VLLLRVPTIASPETAAARVALSEELFELAGDLEDPLLRFHGAMARSAAAGELGDLDAFDQWLGLAAVVASGLDLSLLTWLVHLARASRAYLAGDLAAAERHADDALVSGLEAGHPDAERFSGAVVLAVRQMQGRVAEVLADVVAGTSSDHTDMFLLARGLADAGRLAEVETRYREIAAAGFPMRLEPYAGATLANLAYLAALLGDEDGAAVLYDQLEPWADHFAPVIVFQHAGAHELAMLAAVLGRTDEAHRWFERAVELHSAAGAPLFVAGPSSVGACASAPATPTGPESCRARPSPPR
jgi:hypothetical protein